MSTTSSNVSVKSPRTYKIVILGDGGVGKSALTMQFVSHKFLDYHDPTIEDVYIQQARIDGEAAKVNVLDTAGQPEFTAMKEQYMREGEGFIICYSITDKQSFNEACQYKALCERVRARDDIPFVLVGNKCDLHQLRQITREEGRTLASQWDCPFFETSALLRHFVDDTFYGIVREIRRREQESLSPSSKHRKRSDKRPTIPSIFKSLGNVFKRGNSGSKA